MKNSFLCIIFSIVFLFSGCTNVFDKEPRSDTFSGRAKIFFNALVDHDNETIVELFSPEKKSSHPNLSSEIDKIYEYINGEFVSYERISVADGESVRDGEKVDWHSSTTIYGALTDTGYTYTIGITDILIYKEDSKKVGINYIRVIDDSASQPDFVNGRLQGELDCCDVG